MYMMHHLDEDLETQTLTAIKGFVYIRSNAHAHHLSLNFNNTHFESNVRLLSPKIRYY